MSKIVKRISFFHDKNVFKFVIWPIEIEDSGFWIAVIITRVNTKLINDLNTLAGNPVSRDTNDLNGSSVLLKTFE